MVLAVLGILMAFLDFTGASKRLESVIDEERDLFLKRLRKKSFLKELEDRINRIGDRPIPITSAIILLISILIGQNIYIRLMVFIPSAWPHEVQIVSKVILWIASFIGFFLFFGLAIASWSIILTSLIFALLWGFWFMLYIMNKAPSGTMGTIGLIIAIMSLIVSFLS